MVLQKKLDYGFNGYQVPPTPRAARSVRRRCSFKRKPDDQLMCAFDLLATVAGKLLDGGTCPPPPSSKEQPAVGENRIEKGEKNESKVFEENCCNRDPYERNFLITELVSEAPNPNCCFNELPCTQIDVVSRPVSGITSSDCSEKVGSAEQLVNDNCKLSLGINFTPPADVKSSGFHLSVNCGSEDETREHGKMDFEITRNLSVGNKAPLSSSGHRVEACERKPSPLVSSVDSFKFSLSKNHGPCGSFPLNWDNVKLSNRDDDENSFECTEPSTRNKPFKPPPQVGEYRHRKFLASKHCKEASGVKDEECYNPDAARFNCLNRKDSSKRPRPMRDYPIKKRKIYDYKLESNSDDGINSDRVCKVPEKITNENGLGSGPSRPRVTPAPAVGGHLSIPSHNSQVKIKIKSFRVPELFIEIQENATIGSLKRSVLEAVNAVLGEGLRVGVLLQGKKIRDDSKTLLQTGIFHDNKIDALGFTLEPNPPPAPRCLSPGVRHNQMLPESPQPLTRYAPPPNITQSNGYQGNLDAPPDLPGPSLNNFIESDHDSAPSPPAPSLPLRKVEPESRALVPVPPTKQDALAVVPFRKSKRCESSQRRIRRPFTVSEVEALVQAVEKLGTGRWRDVKLRAFDSAKHRTYVDLKDKWKTLVHTARISPQQRRGEPVPQELLDRVLTAHAYWSQQQAKQQIKSHPDTCLLL